MTQSFSKQESLVVKGFAVLMMLWHHCFLPGRFERYTLSFFPISVGLCVDITLWFKSCVGLFAFVSGYGLYLSYQKWDASHPDRPCGGWLWQRYVHTFSGYWLIVVLAWLLCGFLDGRPKTMYVRSSRLAGLWYALIDFAGIHKLFGTPTVNGTWWYMSAAFLFIMLAPILFSAIRRYGWAPCLSLAFIFPRIFVGYPGEIMPISFLPAFVMGMVCAHTALFDCFDAFAFKSRPKYMICVGSAVFLTGLCFFLSRRLTDEMFWDIKWDLFPLAYILLLHLTISRVSILRGIFAFLGKHSANIFMVHTFFRQIYTMDFVYSRGHFLLVIMTLLILSLVTSFIIEGLKKLIRYDRFTAKLEELSLPSLSEKPDC